MPQTAALSVNSPQSIIQAASTRVPLAAGPAAPFAVRLAGRPEVGDGSVTFRLRTGGPGVAYAYVWDGGILGQKKVEIGRAGDHHGDRTGRHRNARGRLRGDGRWHRERRRRTELSGRSKFGSRLSGQPRSGIR